MKLAVVSSAMATMLAALLVLGPVLVGCSRNGHDTATYADGSTYAGDWRDAVRHGKGIMKYVDGRYTGEWKDGRRHGQGTGTNPDGSTDYTGEWKDNRRNGHGTYVYDDGTTYTGDWKDDEPAP